MGRVIVVRGSNPAGATGERIIAHRQRPRGQSKAIPPVCSDKTAPCVACPDRSPSHLSIGPGGSRARAALYSTSALELDAFLWSPSLSPFVRPGSGFYFTSDSVRRDEILTCTRPHHSLLLRIVQEVVQAGGRGPVTWVGGSAESISPLVWIHRDTTGASCLPRACTDADIAGTSR